MPDSKDINCSEKRPSIAKNQPDANKLPKTGDSNNNLAGIFLLLLALVILQTSKKKAK
ncbi:LPXTG cell wall anchor domain-containing protein [Listeria seeligeri]|uniref:LPXTG cell wall anchor domain-containing protein n=1 Tax=Listeria seeligeri TaxID=1640 RepID=UPI00098CFFFA|nr:LPXTG cell wall anchor domain-containing protein [Listeria seeligeri]MBF2344948.1 LPXTG cell wall anchor domain-containing protein [Listeria seeligeri]MBF2436261.1 LPXTG cell wall anchor domain-containing protein [Listeria seeligeri]MBF2482007.1 LPXTG cell wall anchor domain-containing protein [Listeria seeligeri]MBF2598873.1 LPXTG cell wall anchor domain-containing protein [Listeria seeligeri]